MESISANLNWHVQFEPLDWGIQIMEEKKVDFVKLENGLYETQLHVFMSVFGEYFYGFNSPVNTNVFIIKPNY